MDEFESGFLLGPPQPHVIVRMNAPHEATFGWLQRALPGGRLYGPYSHAGRTQQQFMVRGSYLRDVLVPLVRRWRGALDPNVAGRLDAMCARYRIVWCSRQLRSAGRRIPARKGG